MQNNSRTIFSNPPKGFRLFPTDLVLLGLGVLLPLVAPERYFQAAALFSFSIFHFFLFCNVLRTRAIYELLWAVIFIAHAVYRFGPQGFDWLNLLIYQTPFTLGFALIEIVTGKYRGIFYERFTP